MGTASRLLILASGLLVLTAPGTASAASDLTIVGVYPRDAANMGVTLPETKHKIVTYVEVKNAGTSTTSRKVEVECSLHRGSSDRGTKVGSARGSSKSTMKGYATEVIKVALPAPDRMSSFTVGCRVDPSRSIAESNEGNNGGTATFRASPHNSGAYELKLQNFDRNWRTGSSGHREVLFELYRVGGRVEPTRSFSNAQLGWQAQCLLPSMPWVRIRRVGNMTKQPFGSLPGPQKVGNGSMWLFPVNLAGKPKLSTMGPLLPLHCTLQVGAFVELPTKPGQTDLKPMKVLWKKNFMIQLPNPESNKPIPGDTSPIGEITAANESSITGWACDKDTPTKSVEVELTIGLMKKTVQANQTSNSTVARSCKGGSRHGFSYKLSEGDIDHLRGRSGNDRRVSGTVKNTNDLGRPGTLKGSRTIGVSQGQLDLVAVGAHPRDAKNLGVTWPEVGGKVITYVEVRNDSADRLTQKVTVQCSLHRGSNSRGTRVGRPVTATASETLTAYATQTVKVVLPEVDRMSHFTVDCSVDSNQRFKEKSESNNRVSATFRASLRQSNAYQIKLVDFEDSWGKGSHGHYSLRFKAYQPGGVDQPSKNFTKLKLGWQTQCQIPVAYWAKVREQGNMTHFPFGALPGRGKKASASAWVFPLNLSGKPDVRKMGKTLPMMCKVVVGIFHLGPSKANPNPGNTDLVPIKVLWSGGTHHNVKNPMR